MEVALHLKIKFVSYRRIQVINAVLPVFAVLTAQLWQLIGFREQINRGISLAEFLEAESFAMPQDLGRNRPGGEDLNAHRGHLEDGPVAMLGAVAQQAGDVV